MSTEAYIINRYRGAEAVKLLLDRLLKDYTSDDYQFFVHVYCCTLISLSKHDEGWVPVSYKLMQSNWGRKVNIQFEKMVEDGLLEVKSLGEFELSDGTLVPQTYSKKDGLSREFRIHESVLGMVVSEASLTLEEAKKSKYYNLMDGKLINKLKEPRYPKYDTAKNSYPQLILDALELIELCTVNIKCIEEYINKLKSLVETPFSGGTRRDSKLLAIDNCAYQQIISNIVKEYGDFVDYRVIFSSKGPQMSGRVTETGVGMQNCSRAMKQAAFTNVPNIRNYDLKSSQVWGLIQQFEDLNDDGQWKNKVDTTWLVNYLSQDKQTYADKVGVSKDRWKECFLALIMGAYAPKVEKVTLEDFTPVKSIKKVAGELVEVLEPPKDAIFKALYKEADGDIDLAFNYYTNFYELIKVLKVSIDIWHEWLIKRYIDRVSIYPKGGRRVFNKTGMTFDLAPYQSSKGWVQLDKLKRKMAAFFLQGTEASFIHHLTILSKDYSYIVMNNQHDGGIFIGEVPEDAINIAKERSGLRHASLEEKGFL